MYPVPAAETARLAALSRLDILDTAPSPAFDRICQIAQEHFRVPFVLVTFIDRDRAWAKAMIGLQDPTIRRDDAFCAHTIMGDEVLVIPDTLRDSRSAQNPFVTGQPHVRFYAGAPIVLSTGLRVGSVCIMDTKPRTLSRAEAVVLKNLADIAVTELRLLQAGRLARDCLSERAFASV
ncbi:histidine kinase [Alsobacter soli]|uniref:Histidine kinase n=1 Tax=Alsobacter soli TaxID=2109933 RepID=A0A2T1HV74_9HYPH|nr:GAF domain-containing protein [Alsobacter soli]PSC05419.1 histidine kinase [Alsobacter soli]